MCCLLFAAPLLAASAHADVFETLDDDGHPTYSDVPKTQHSVRVVGESGNESIVARRDVSHVLPLVRQLALEHALDASLILALISVESDFNPRALSHAGAMGLMQLIPETAARYGVRDPYDPKQNIEGGIRYLNDLLARHNGNVVLALSAYNSGPNAVAKHGARVPPYPETMLFVAAVLARAQQNSYE